MIPNERLIFQLVKGRQVEIQQQFKRYHRAQVVRAARPSAPQRLAALRRSLWNRVVGVEAALLPRSARGDPTEER